MRCSWSEIWCDGSWPSMGGSTGTGPIGLGPPLSPIIQEETDGRQGFVGLCPCGLQMRMVPTYQWAWDRLFQHVAWRHAPRTWLFTDKVARMVED